MSHLRSAALPMALSRAACCCVLGLGLLSAGCASKQPLSQPARVNTSAQTARVEIEDDGLPAQVAPRNRRPGFDDPTQPWSPNYGGPQEPVIHLSDEPRRVRYASDAEALAAARSRLETLNAPQTPVAVPPVRVVNGQGVRRPATPQRVQYATEAEALAAARGRLATMAAPSVTSPGRPVQVLNAPANPPVARLSGVDEDALVRRAIAEHEMRRRD